MVYKIKFRTAFLTLFVTTCFYKMAATLSFSGYLSSHLTKAMRQPSNAFNQSVITLQKYI